MTDMWGDIKIIYNDSLVNNLYLFNAEIINNTSKDAPKNMVVTFSVEQGAAFFLRETGVIKNGDVKLGLKLDPGYFAQLLDVKERWNQLPAEERTSQDPINYEIDHVITHRKFVLPILNRQSIASFNFLIAANTPEIPILSIGIYEPGVSLTWLESAARKKRRDLWKNILITFSFFGLAFPIMHFSPSITWAVWLMIANSFISYVIGWVLLSLLRVVKIL